MSQDEIITGVAILTEDGCLWSLPKPNRHCHIFALAAFTGRTAEPSIQGFTTSHARFVSREEAARLSGRTGKLYSEDMW